MINVRIVKTVFYLSHLIGIVIIYRLIFINETDIINTWFVYYLIFLFLITVIQLFNPVVRESIIKTFKFNRSVVLGKKDEEIMTNFQDMRSYNLEIAASPKKRWLHPSMIITCVLVFSTLILINETYNFIEINIILVILYLFCLYFVVYLSSKTAQAQIAYEKNDINNNLTNFLNKITWWQFIFIAIVIVLSLPIAFAIILSIV
mgnify:CR=1 FL=1